jgi:hypothetical protein
MGVTIIVTPTRAHELARLFMDKTGMWVAAAIRAVFGLSLTAAASESKAPPVLTVLGLLILLFAIVTPILGLDRHRRLIEWWIAQPRMMQISSGVVSFIFGILLIYLIL